MDLHEIDPFVRSTANVFRTMLECEIECVRVCRKGNDTRQFDITGAIGLSGTRSGSVVLSLSSEAAYKVTEYFLMEVVTAMNDDVIDVVGELVNMAAGGAKAELAEDNLCLGLPTVIVGDRHSIALPKIIEPVCAELGTPWGPAELEVGLAPVSEVLGAVDAHLEVVPV
ncbi:MAG: chemotaxis protein CheX [Planctomycetaceae bacterium]